MVSLNRILIHVAVFAGVFCTFRLFYRLGDNSSAPTASGASDADTTFPFDLIELSDAVNSHQVLDGRPTVVLSAYTRVERQVKDVVAAAKASAKRPFNLLILSDDPIRVKEQLHDIPHVFYTSAGKFDRLLRAFKASRLLPAWIVYDERGVLRGRGGPDD